MMRHHRREPLAHDAGRMLREKLAATMDEQIAPYIVPLIEIIQDLQTEVTELRAEIGDLRNRRDATS